MNSLDFSFWVCLGLWAIDISGSFCYLDLEVESLLFSMGCNNTFYLVGWNIYVYLVSYESWFDLRLVECDMVLS